MSSFISRSAVLAFARLMNQALALIGPLLLVRLLQISEYGEYRPGLLILVLGDGYRQSQSVEYNLGRLLKAYGAYLQYRVPPVLELWLNGEKIGEYTNQGLLLGPEFSQPR